MNKRTFFITFLWLSLYYNAFSVTPPDTAYKVLVDTIMLKTRIKNYSNNLQSIESNFTQKKYLSVLTEPSKSAGNFCFKEPSMVRWEYTEPFKYLLLIRDNRLYVLDNNKSKSYNTTSSKAFVALNSIMGNLLRGSVFENKADFFCKYYENTFNFKIVLVPRMNELKNYFNSIIIYFDKKLFSVSRLTLIEKKGDTTDLEFINRKINESISEEKFNIR